MSEYTIFSKSNDHRTYCRSMDSVSDEPIFIHCYRSEVSWSVGYDWYDSIRHIYIRMDYDLPTYISSDDWMCWGETAAVPMAELRCKKL